MDNFKDSEDYTKSFFLFEIQLKGFIQSLGDAHI